MAAQHRRVWLIYTFPQDMTWRRPKLRRYIVDQFREERVVPGTVGDGEVRVCVREAAL